MQYNVNLSGRNKINARKLSKATYCSVLTSFDFCDQLGNIGSYRYGSSGRHSGVAWIAHCQRDAVDTTRSKRPRWDEQPRSVL